MVGTTNYWITVTLHDDGGYDLSNGTGTDPCIVNCGDNSVYVSDSDFKIPVDSGLTVGNFYIENSKVTVEGSITSSSNPKINLTNSNINVKGGYISLSTKACIFSHDTASTFQVSEFGRISKACLFYMEDNMRTSCAMMLCNITTGPDENDSFTIGFTEDYFITLEGSFIGYNMRAAIGDNGGSRGYGDEWGFIFKDVSFRNLNINPCSENEFFIKLEPTNKTVNLLENNVIIGANGTVKEFQNLFKSVDGQVMLAAIWSNGGTTEICGLFDENGFVDYYLKAKLIGAEGIKSIKTDSDYGDGKYLFFKQGASLDLTSINVQCISGYSFKGWYYINEYNIETKITDPKHFMAVDNTVIYAKAAEDQIPAPIPEDKGQVIRTGSDLTLTFENVTVGSDISVRIVYADGTAIDVSRTYWRVVIDPDVVSNGSYAAFNGSRATVTLSASYISTLDTGSYTVQLMSGGTTVAGGSFTAVNDTPSPGPVPTPSDNILDDKNIVFVISVFAIVIAAIGLAYVIVKARK